MKWLIKIWVKKLINPKYREIINKLLGRDKLDEVSIIYELLKENASCKVMIDVGAHHGGSLEKYALDRWDVYAFEPDPSNRMKLTRFCKNLPNVKIDSRALSENEKKDVSFYSSDISEGISSLSSFHASHKESAQVNVTTLKRFINDKSIKCVDFLKIDTEGHDYFVLKGFPWSSMKPRVVLCEFEDRKTKVHGYDYKEMAEFLVNKGYEVIISEWYPITEYGQKHTWRSFMKFPCELKDKNAWGNMIAVHKDEDYQNLNRLIKF